MIKLTGAINARPGLTVVLFISVITFFGSCLDALEGQQKRKNADGALDALRQLGAVVGKAVLDRDVPTLLRYDRADLRAEDESSLKNKKSDLFCFLFDSTCLPSGQGRSVYEKLSKARKLEIKVIDGGKSRRENVRYAILLFYDRSAISERLLRSREFLCKQALDRIVSWKFKMADSKWEPVTPLFDNETDTLCPPE